MDRSLYPSNWHEIATKIKADANWHCQECGKPCRRPREPLEVFEERIWDIGHLHGWFEDLHTVDEESGEVGYGLASPGKFVLTVAHLNHVPSDCRPENLKALCSVCHLRYDNQFRAEKKRLKREREGQLSLGLEVM